SPYQPRLQYFNDKDFQSNPLLTKTQTQLFQFLLQHKTTKQIPTQLFITQNTVPNHISNPIQKLPLKPPSHPLLHLLRIPHLHL
ncbi:LuxR C-terminal-related transcriptional regulator, partial [Bacillus pumilus]|uniref:LuxR C-terminal-related transcriptional regulator n=1 Tax=Bacillus pumilus TaxID=1408 RepID=UPI0011A79D58